MRSPCKHAVSMLRWSADESHVCRIALWLQWSLSRRILAPGILQTTFSCVRLPVGVPPCFCMQCACLHHLQEPMLCPDRWHALHNSRYRAARLLHTKGHLVTARLKAHPVLAGSHPYLTGLGIFGGKYQPSPIQLSERSMRTSSVSTEESCMQEEMLS